VAVAKGTVSVMVIEGTVSIVVVTEGTVSIVGVAAAPPLKPPSFCVSDGHVLL
jgi:hypothetical protein